MRYAFYPKTSVPADLHYEWLSPYYATVYFRNKDFADVFKGKTGKWYIVANNGFTVYSNEGSVMERISVAIRKATQKVGYW